jgi:hypothetical protein
MYLYLVWKVQVFFWKYKYNTFYLNTRTFKYNYPKCTWKYEYLSKKYCTCTFRKILVLSKPSTSTFFKVQVKYFYLLYLYSSELWSSSLFYFSGIRKYGWTTVSDVAEWCQNQPLEKLVKNYVYGIKFKAVS